MKAKSKKALKAMAKSVVPNDKRMILNPEIWPMWPNLPIKRKVAGDNECAIVWAGDFKLDPEDPGDEATPTKPLVLRDGKIKVYKVNLFDLPPTVEEFRKTEKYSYDSVDALLADGWVVD